MNRSETEQRIYVGDCGCVRLESKHFRVTMQPTEFIEMLRKIVREKADKPFFCNRLTISNNVDSNGFVQVQKQFIKD